MNVSWLANERLRNFGFDGEKDNLFMITFKVLAGLYML